MAGAAAEPALVEPASGEQGCAITGGMVLQVYDSPPLLYHIITPSCIHHGAHGATGMQKLETQSPPCCIISSPPSCIGLTRATGARGDRDTTPPPCCIISLPPISRMRAHLHPPSCVPTPCVPPPFPILAAPTPSLLFTHLLRAPLLSISAAPTLPLLFTHSLRALMPSYARLPVYSPLACPPFCPVSAAGGDRATAPAQATRWGADQACGAGKGLTRTEPLTLTLTLSSVSAAGGDRAAAAAAAQAARGRADQACGARKAILLQVGARPAARRPVQPKGDVVSSSCHTSIPIYKAMDSSTTHHS